MKFCSAYYSDVGKKETNQDSLLLMQRRQPQGDEIVFAVICDGVGGLKMGEQASAEVVTAFHDWFTNQIEGLYQQEIPMTALFNDWDKLIQELHGLLKEHSENAGFRSGTTVEAVLLMKNQYYICHIGDCRTYVISDTIDQLTTDHTVVQREITEGKLTPQQAAKDPRQSLLLQCVGAGNAVKPDYLYGDIKPHQVFLLCCDGFRRRITGSEIKEICKYSTKEKKLHDALEEVIRLCKKRKETDNITGILIMLQFFVRDTDEFGEIQCFQLGFGQIFQTFVLPLVNQHLAQIPLHTVSHQIHINLNGDFLIGGVGVGNTDLG